MFSSMYNINNFCFEFLKNELILNLGISIRHCNVMHHLNGYINGHLKSRRANSIWIEWVPNTFPFYNQAPGSRFWLVDSVLSFPFLDCNLGNKAMYISCYQIVSHSNKWKVVLFKYVPCVCLFFFFATKNKWRLHT